MPTTVTKILGGKMNLVSDGAGYTVNLTLPTVTGTALPNALDNQVIEEVYLICDTTAGGMIINLPAISALNNAWNVKIYICQVAGTNGVTVYPYSTEMETDTLNGNARLVAQYQYDTYYLHVVSDNMWMALYCGGLD